MSKVRRLAKYVLKQVRVWRLVVSNNHPKEGHTTNIHIHIGEMLARNGRMYPNDIALIERIPAEKKRATVTWREFGERANRFANGLRSRGIKKGDKVIHLMNNSIDWLIVYS